MRRLTTEMTMQRPQTHPLISSSAASPEAGRAERAPLVASPPSPPKGNCSAPTTTTSASRECPRRVSKTRSYSLRPVLSVSRQQAGRSRLCPLRVRQLRREGPIAPSAFPAEKERRTSGRRVVWGAMRRAARVLRPHLQSGRLSLVETTAQRHASSTPHPTQSNGAAPKGGASGTASSEKAGSTQWAHRPASASAAASDAAQLKAQGASAATAGKAAPGTAPVTPAASSSAAKPPAGQGASTSSSSSQTSGQAAPAGASGSKSSSSFAPVAGVAVAAVALGAAYISLRRAPLRCKQRGRTYRYSGLSLLSSEDRPWGPRCCLLHGSCTHCLWRPI